MKRLYVADNLIEAHLLRDVLGQSGIHAEVFNQHMQGAVGEVPFTHTYPELWVAGEEMTRADCVLQAFLSRAPNNEQRSCPHCTETVPADFLTCWNCGQALASI